MMLTKLACATVCLAAGFLGLGTSAAEPPVPKQMDRPWCSLATDDPVKAAQAVTALVAQPKQTVPFLKKKLRPIARPDPRRLAQLIADLDDSRFAVREGATKELEQAGGPAEAPLRKALADRPSLEVSRRIERILETHKRERLHPPPDCVRLTRAVEVLELIGNAAARQLLGSLARGSPDVPLTWDAEGALERLSKQSASP